MALRPMVYPTANPNSAHTIMAKSTMKITPDIRTSALRRCWYFLAVVRDDRSARIDELASSFEIEVDALHEMSTAQGHR